MQTICYWTKRPELSQKAESFTKEKVNHDTRIYRRNRVFTIAGVAFLSISGVSIAGCLLRMLAHIIAGVPDDDPQFYIWRLFLSLSTLAVGLILFRVRPVLEELPWPDWICAVYARRSPPANSSLWEACSGQWHGRQVRPPPPGV